MSKEDTGNTRVRKKLKLAKVLKETTIRDPPFFYLHLTLATAQRNGAKVVDPITASTHLSSALERFLGLTGAAIPIDILKCQASDVWIRVPNSDGSAVIEALSGWVSESEEITWRIRSSSVWLGALGMGDENDVFE